MLGRFIRNGMRENFVRYKVLLTLAVFFVCGGSAYASLKILGVSLKGDCDKFCQKLEKKGLVKKAVPEENTELYAVYSGDYLGYSNVEFEIFKPKSSNQLEQGRINFPVCTSWSELYRNYSIVKTRYLDRIGVPKDSREILMTKGQPKTDGDIFIEVMHGNIQYSSIFVSKAGTVIVAIVPGKKPYIKVIFLASH